MNMMACFREADFGCADCLYSAQTQKMGEFFFLYFCIMVMSGSCRENTLISSLIFLLGSFSELGMGAQSGERL